jgi:ABC-type multidrug transport system fused ATPase/permease subunit
MFIIGAIVFLFTITWVLTSVLIASLLRTTILGFFFGRFIKNITKSIQDTKAQGSILAEEGISNIRTIKAFSSEDIEITSFFNNCIKVYNLGYRRTMVAGCFGVMIEVIIFGSLITIIYTAAYLFKEGKLNIGDLTAFLLYLMQLLVSFAIVAGIFS